MNCMKTRQVLVQRVGGKQVRRSVGGEDGGGITRWKLTWKVRRGEDQPRGVLYSIPASGRREGAAECLWLCKNVGESGVNRGREERKKRFGIEGVIRKRDGVCVHWGS